MDHPKYPWTAHVPYVYMEHACTICVYFTTWNSTITGVSVIRFLRLRITRQAYPRCVSEHCSSSLQKREREVTFGSIFFENLTKFRSVPSRNFPITCYIPIDSKLHPLHLYAIDLSILNVGFWNPKNNLIPRSEIPIELQHTPAG